MRCVCCGRSIKVSQLVNGSGFRRLYSLRKKLLQRKDVLIRSWVMHEDQAGYLLAHSNGFHRKTRVKPEVRGIVLATFGVLNGKIYLDDLPHCEHGHQMLTPSQINRLMGLRGARRRPIAARTKQRVLEFWKHRCARCGTRDDLEIHHKRAVVHGGGNQFSNLIVLCRKCHFRNAHDFSEHIWPDLQAAFLKSENPTST